MELRPAAQRRSRQTDKTAPFGHARFSPHARRTLVSVVIATLLLGPILPAQALPDPPPPTPALPGPEATDLRYYSDSCDPINGTFLVPATACGHVLLTHLAPAPGLEGSFELTLTIVLGADVEHARIGVGYAGYNFGVRVSGLAGTTAQVQASFAPATAFIGLIPSCVTTIGLTASWPESEPSLMRVEGLVFSHGQSMTSDGDTTYVEGTFPSPSSLASFQSGGLSVEVDKCASYDVLTLTGASVFSGVHAKHLMENGKSFTGDLTGLPDVMTIGLLQTATLTVASVDHAGSNLGGSMQIGDDLTVAVEKLPHSIQFASQDLPNAEIDYVTVGILGGLPGGSVTVTANDPGSPFIYARLVNVIAGTVALHLDDKHAVTDRITFHNGAGTADVTVRGPFDAKYVDAVVDADDLGFLELNIGWGDTVTEGTFKHDGSLNADILFRNLGTSTPTVRADLHAVPTALSFSVERDSNEKTKSISATFSGGSVATRLDISGKLDKGSFVVEAGALVSGTLDLDVENFDYSGNLAFASGLGSVYVKVDTEKAGKDIDIILVADHARTLALDLSNANNYFFMGSKHQASSTGGTFRAIVDVDFPRFGLLAIDAKVDRPGSSNYNLYLPGKDPEWKPEGSCISKGIAYKILVASTDDITRCNQ